MKAFGLIISTILLFSCENKKEIDVCYNQGIVSSTKPEATEIGLDILARGGNAFDAAVAVNFALAVAYPRAGNIGGGGFAVYSIDGNNFGALDFRETAPAASSENMFLDENEDVIKDKSLKSGAAVAVPGTVKGMFELHKKFGKLPWKILLEPSITLAEKGLELSKDEAEIINKFQDDFKEVNQSKIPMLNEYKWQEGDSIRYPKLANFLNEIANNGCEYFYNDSTVTAQITKAINKHGGIFSSTDLNNYHVVWRDAIAIDFYGYRLISMPPPSSGGIALGQLIKGAEILRIDTMRPHSAELYHAYTELARRVYADRATYLGDPDFIEIPKSQLLDDAYLQDRFSNISFDAKSASIDIKEGKVSSIESFETTHFSVIDKNGQAVSITTTLNGHFGSKIMVEEYQFFLNNEMDDFSSKPGVPNQFGLIGSSANAIAPNKRMLSSMTPTIVHKDGEVVLVLGSPGGSTIIMTVFQTLVNNLIFKMPLQEAVNAPKMHAQWLPDKIYLEESVGDTISISLQKLGHEIERIPFLGKMNCIGKLHDSCFVGAADSIRSEGNWLGLNPYR